MTIFLLCLNVALVVGAALYLDWRFKSHVNKVIASGCPMADTEKLLNNRLSDIDRKLAAHESQMSEVVSESHAATSKVNAIEARERRVERIKVAPPHRVPVAGL